MNKLIYSIIIAAALWFVMFSPLTAPHVNFWMTMAVSSVILTGLVTVFDRGWWRRLKPEFPDLFAGICIAAVLWGVFWVGDKVSSWLFDFARGQVDAIYGIKDGASPWLLSVLLLLLIGPAEEIFWRGYVQRTLSLRLGRTRDLSLRQHFILWFMWHPAILCWLWHLLWSVSPGASFTGFSHSVFRR